MRSIEKLSIPDWYLNNNSRPPRILLNGTPIDQRPAAWKNVSAKTSPETSVVEPNDSTGTAKNYFLTNYEKEKKTKNKKTSMKRIKNGNFLNNA